MQAYRLITLRPSHYCEKARWALARCRVPFEEEAHVPIVHALHSLRAGGKRSLPVLVTDSGTFADSTEILELCDRQVSGSLFGSGEEGRRSRELEEHFDEKLGPHTRRLVYFHVLGDKALMMHAFETGVGPGERAAFSVGFLAITALMRRSMKIDREGAGRSRERVLAVFREVAELLSDGRRYLTGDRFTAADLTFAALAAPVVLPPEYGCPMPAFETLSTTLRSEIRHLRDTAAGDFALRLYREERGTVLPIGD